MRIQNFTDSSIRLGEYPQCADVQAMRYADGKAKYHTSYGIHAQFYPCNMDGYKCRVVVIREKGSLRNISVFACKWDEQAKVALELHKDDDVLFDSGPLTDQS